jgi:hypothetical protein
MVGAAYSLDWRYASGPAGKIASIVIDTSLDCAFLFGGSGSSGPTNRTWQLKLDTLLGYSFSLYDTGSARPTARLGHAACFDPTANKMYIFGGTTDGVTPYNDIWTFDVSSRTWQQLSPPGPRPIARTWVNGIYHPTRRSFVIVDGKDINLQGIDDVWEYKIDSARWTLLSPAGNRPRARWSYGLCYDATTDRIIMTCGEWGMYYNETWALTMTPGAESWQQLSPSGTPPSARSTVGCSYDPALRRMYIFGGIGGSYYNDLYELDLVRMTWTQLSPGGTPPAARRGATGGFDPINRCLLFNGGQASSGYPGELIYVPMGPLPTNLDVAVRSILAPAGAVDSGTALTPRAVVQNVGFVATRFPVTMLIGSGYVRTVTDSLAPGQLDTVEFPAWTAAPVGPVPVVCFTALAGDENRANDTAMTIVTVRRDTSRDVAAVAILAPVGTVDSGFAVTPQAVVRNQGAATAVFPVALRIGTAYGFALQETLAAGAIDTLTFPDWVATPVGSLPVTCFVAMAGDASRANDTVYGSVTVRRRLWLDVGVTAIVAPRGTVDSATPVAPRAVVRNYGQTDTAFTVTLAIDTGYRQSISAALAAGASDTVTFPNWVALPVGWRRAVCFTTLAGDLDPANDTLRDSAYVIGTRYHDVLPDSLFAPGATARPGDTVVPRVRVRNRGNLSERYFDVSVQLGTDYTSTRTVVTPLAPGGQVELAFDSWVAEPGDYTATVVTLLGSDDNRANDTLRSRLYVYSPPSLDIEWDRTDIIHPGERKSWHFYALLQGDFGDTVRLVSPSAPPGWSVALYDSAGLNPLAGLGYVPLDTRRWFSLNVTAPDRLAGGPGAIDTVRFFAAGYPAADPARRDSAALRLAVAPDLEIHNYPNPLVDRTTFVIGLPYDGTATLTVFNRVGETVARILSAQPVTAGVRMVDWVPLNRNGTRVAPGVYDYVLDYSWAGRAERIRKKLVIEAR